MPNVVKTPPYHVSATAFTELKKMNLVAPDCKKVFKFYGAINKTGNSVNTPLPVPKK